MIRIFFLLLIFISVSFGSDEENPKRNNHIIGSNLFSLIPYNGVSFYDLHYQNTLSNYSALNFNVIYPVNSDDVGYGLGIAYKYFPLNTSPKKLYLGLRMLYTTLDNEVESAEAEVFSFGTYAGWQIMGKHLSLDFGFGIDYNTGPSLQDKILERGQTNVTPLLIISLGWAWN